MPCKNDEVAYCSCYPWITGWACREPEEQRKEGGAVALMCLAIAMEDCCSDLHCILEREEGMEGGSEGEKDGSHQ